MMKTSAKQFVSLCLAFGILAASSAAAHHSQAFYNKRTKITVEGTITKFVWLNPHTWLYMDVVNEKGDIEKWIVETNSAVSLTRDGWRPNTFKKGDIVQVTVWPLKNGDPGGMLKKVVMASGKILTQP